MEIILLALNTIFYMINGILGIISQIIIYIYIYYKDKEECKDNVLTIIKLIIVSIPTSFINITGGEYGNLPVSWFNIIIILSSIYLILLYMKNRYINLGISFFNLMIVMFILYYFIGLVICDNKMSGISSFLTVCTPMLFILLISIIKNLDIKYDELKKLYIKVALGSAIGFMFQLISHKVFGMQFGYITYMLGRIAYAGIFRDFSFYSVYLASAAQCIIMDFIMNTNKNIKALLSGIFLCLASILTSARTGIMSLAIAFLILIITMLFFGNEKNKIKALIFIPILLIASTISINILLSIRKDDTQSIIGDSGRSGTYKSAITTFKENPLFGIGLGIDNYENYVQQNLFGFDDTIPHNFIMQSLAQLGILGTMLLIILILYICIMALKIPNKEISYMFLVTLVSNFVLPDMLNTRYIVIQILLIIISYKAIKCKI